MDPNSETDADGVEDMLDDAGATAEAGAELPATAESSPATDVSKTPDQDTVSLIRDAVAKKPEAGADAASSADGVEEGQEKEGSDEDGEQEPDNEDYSDVPFNKHPRFQQLLGRVKTAETDAQRYRNVEGFLQQQGLGPDETVELLTIGGLMKHNPAEAWKRIKPKIQQLLVAAGELLPDDLKQRVQNGDLPHDAALEISRSRQQAASLQATQQFQQDQQRRQQETSLQESVRTAAETWETDRRLKDPNFEAKVPALLREVAYLQQTEGKPNTPEGVRAQLKKAYDSLPSLPTSAAPAAPRSRQAVAPVRGGQVAGNTRPAPESTLDIIRAARQRA